MKINNLNYGERADDNGPLLNDGQGYKEIDKQSHKKWEEGLATLKKEFLEIFKLKESKGDIK